MGFVKTCTKCGRTLTLDHFSPAPSYKYGVYSRCHECVNEASKQYARTHREKVSQRNKEYRQRWEEKQRQLRELQDCEILGGYRIYVLNYCKEGEAKYTCVKVETAEVYRTNDKRKFLDYLEGVI